MPSTAAMPAHQANKVAPTTALQSVPGLFPCRHFLEATEGDAFTTLY